MNAVARISELVGAMGQGLLESQPQLRRRNRIKTIAGTLAIEGNTLTEEQVMAILDGKRVMGAALELAWDVMRFWVCEIRDDTDACIRRIQDWVNQ